MSIKFEELNDFQKDLSRLLKKYSTLVEDLNVLKKFLLIYPRGFPPRVFPVSYKQLKLRDGAEGYKVKHFRCRTLLGRGSQSGIRVIYIFEPAKSLITFVEIYFKEEQKSDCDLGRINYYFGQIKF